MNKFLATLDRLSSGFADDVVAAVRKTPADELYRVLGKTPPAPPSAPAVVKRTAAPAPKKAAPAKKDVAPKKKAAPIAKKEVAPKKEVVVKANPAPAPKKEAPAPKKEAPAPKKSPAPVGPLGAAAIVSVRRFFEECGRRGATAQQVQRHLEHDETDTRVPTLLRELTRDGVIRDAGFRRTTGNGTQPVLVIA